MDKAHMDNVPRRRARSTGPSRSAGPGLRVGRSGSTRVTGRVSPAPVDGTEPEPSAVATEVLPVPRSTGRRGRVAGSRPSANRPASAPPTSTGRRVGRIAAAGRSSQPTAPMAKSRLALYVAVLGLVFVAVAFAVAVPLRNYLSQREQLAAAVATEQAMTAQKTLLQQQQAALSDPDYLANEAKRRLQLVKPGDTVYIVHAPALPTPAAPHPTAPAAQRPWYSNLWDTLSDPVAPAGHPTTASAAPTGRDGR